MTEIKYKSLTEALNESVLIKKPGDFTKPNQLEADTQNEAMYKLLMTLSNLHSAVSDVQKMSGNTMWKWHADMSDKIRSEANRNKNK